MAIDRRVFLGTAVAGATLLSSAEAKAEGEVAGAGPAQLPPPRAVPKAPPPTVTPQLARFISGTDYEKLPPEVVRGAKLYLIDAIGCGLAGHVLSKGRHVTAVMAAMGGSGARILGTGQRVSPSAAGFANGELINALDYDALPHHQPFVAASALAMAEAQRASGKALILATAIGHEIAVRTSTLPLTMGRTTMDSGTTPDHFGNGNESILGAAAAAARLLELDEAKTEMTLGLATYYCTVASSRTWEMRDQKPECKYNSLGPSVQNAIVSALLAQSGYTGDPGAMDHPLGFPFIFINQQWDPARVVQQLGTSWAIPRNTFKAYAACRFIHSQIDVLTRMRVHYGFAADDIESIHSKCFPFLAKPDMMNVKTPEDAQFSTPYMLALVAMGIPLDAHCQDMKLIQSPKVRKLMEKISWEWKFSPAQPGGEQRNNFYCEIEVKAGGKVYRDTGQNPTRLTSDEDIARKFLANAETILPKAKAERALAMLQSLETLQDTRALIDQLVTG